MAVGVDPVDTYDEDSEYDDGDVDKHDTDYMHMIYTYV